jgi:hypothetical protein
MREKFVLKNLVPLDGTECGEVAIPCAEFIAQQCSSTLVFVCTWAAPVYNWGLKVQYVYAPSAM